MKKKKNTVVDKRKGKNGLRELVFIVLKKLSALLTAALISQPSVTLQRSRQSYVPKKLLTLSFFSFSRASLCLSPLSDFNWTGLRVKMLSFVASSFCSSLFYRETRDTESPAWQHTRLCVCVCEREREQFIRNSVANRGINENLKIQSKRSGVISLRYFSTVCISITNRKFRLYFSSTDTSFITDTSIISIMRLPAMFRMLQVFLIFKTWRIDRTLKKSRTLCAINVIQYVVSRSCKTWMIRINYS